MLERSGLVRSRPPNRPDRDRDRGPVLAKTGPKIGPGPVFTKSNRSFDAILGGPDCGPGPSRSWSGLRPVSSGPRDRTSPSLIAYRYYTIFVHSEALVNFVGTDILRSGSLPEGLEKKTFNWSEWSQYARWTDIMTPSGSGIYIAPAGTYDAPLVLEESSGLSTFSFEQCATLTVNDSSNVQETPPAPIA